MSKAEQSFIWTAPSTWQVPMLSIDISIGLIKSSVPSPSFVFYLFGHALERDISKYDDGLHIEGCRSTHSHSSHFNRSGDLFLLQAMMYRVTHAYLGFNPLQKNPSIQWHPRVSHTLRIDDTQADECELCKLVLSVQLSLDRQNHQIELIPDTAWSSPL